MFHLDDLLELETGRTSLVNSGGVDQRGGGFGKTNKA